MYILTLTLNILETMKDLIVKTKLLRNELF